MSAAARTLQTIMAKIGIDIRLIGKQRTGDEVVFFNLVSQLAKLDSENEYFLFSNVTDSVLLEEIQHRLGIAGKRNFSIVALPVKNKFLWNLWTLPRYLRNSDIEIYQTQYVTPWFIPKKIKIITIIHDVSFAVYPQYINWKDLLLLKIFIPISLRRANAIIAVSEFTKKEINKHYGVRMEKIYCVHNAIGEEFQQIVSQEKCEKMRKKYGLPEKFILYMGTLQPRKNIAQLIRAYAKMNNKERVGLVIAGNIKGHNFDQEIPKALNETSLADKVIFPGYIDDEDKVAIYAAATVVAFPSIYEGFGIPALEAMSQKVPVAANNIESLKEICGDAALFIDTANLDEFSQKLYTLCVDMNVREKLIQSGIERVSFFSWKKSAEKNIAIYNKIIAK